MELLEEWKDIDGYTGLYQISTFGRIKSFRQSSRCKSNNGYIMNPGKDNIGYATCILNNNGIRKAYKVHRLVALTFIPNPYNYTDVNHKDENKLNNRIDNLEWMSHKDNMNYGTLRERMKIYSIKNNKKRKVLQYSLDNQLISEWNSIAEASKFLNLNNGCAGNIVNCCKGRCKNAYGYIWKYKL